MPLCRKGGVTTMGFDLMGYTSVTTQNVGDFWELKKKYSIEWF